MTKEFNLYKCKLVREKQISYKSEIRNPDDVFGAAKAMGFVDYTEEVLGILTTDIKGGVTGYHEISRGDLNTAVVHPREIYKRVLLTNSSAIILVHNHPSGDVTPSEKDIQVTKRLVEVGEIMGVPVLDHLIIGSNGNYFSMKTNGLL